MTEFLKNLTFRLIPRPSFLEGMGRALDIGGGLLNYNVSATPLEGDFKAIASDWIMVGHDFNLAVSEYEQESQKQRRAQSGFTRSRH